MSWLGDFLFGRKSEEWYKKELEYLYSRRHQRIDYVARKTKQRERGDEQSIEKSFALGLPSISEAESQVREINKQIEKIIKDMRKYGCNVPKDQYIEGLSNDLKRYVYTAAQIQEFLKKFVPTV